MNWDIVSFYHFIKNFTTSFLKKSFKLFYSLNIGKVGGSQDTEDLLYEFNVLCTDEPMEKQCPFFAKEGLTIKDVKSHVTSMKDTNPQKGTARSDNRNSSGLSGCAWKHPSNILLNFDMAAGWWSGISFDEINGHCYSCLLYQQSKHIKL